MKSTNQQGSQRVGLLLDMDQRTRRWFGHVLSRVFLSNHHERVPWRPQVIGAKRHHLNSGIHLVEVEYADTGDEPQNDPVERRGLCCLAHPGRVVDLVLLGERYVAVQYADDGDGPLLDDD